ncbi:MAG: sodium:solute symporter [Muribaculaceae bacterium]
MLIAIVLIYFAILYTVSYFTGSNDDSNDSFFRGNRQSPWYMVAFGMIGASVSGISFVSVPGMVLHSQMTYMQTCLGFIIGYFIVAFVLLPLYYRLNLTTIYSYLGTRFGSRTYSTGASFFIISKLTGAALKFYVVCILLHDFVLKAYGIPFYVTVVAMVLLIWLYTRRGGIKTLVITDVIQTACMLAALVLITYNVLEALNLTVPEAVSAISDNSLSHMFVFDDWISKQNFWKQFISGAFIVVVMTGLDQDMMQKNLTCKSLREAQKDMCTYGFAFAPVNLLFLALGVLLTMLAAQQGIEMPASSDSLLPMFAATGSLGTSVVIIFTLGIVAASFSSADSALTSLTTSFCVDILRRSSHTLTRRIVHIAMCAAFVLFILLFRYVNSTSLIDAIYIICSYTYGPLLGLFAFGLLTKRATCDKAAPYIAVAAPLLCYAIDRFTSSQFGYSFGYELLLLNGVLTFAGLYIFRSRETIVKA